MKSIKNIGKRPAGISISSDEIIEFHASRIVLLIFQCGTKTKGSEGHSIDGLTKLAKLDFFVRYPSFFNKISKYLNKEGRIESEDVESKMIRYHYGPWDKRYYQVLPFLEARGILRIEKHDKQFVFSLTTLGEKVANDMKSQKEFQNIIEKMKIVGATLKTMSGNRLKELIYEVFKTEVANKNLDEIINY